MKFTDKLTRAIERVFFEMSNNSLVEFADALTLEGPDSGKDSGRLILKIIKFLQNKEYAIIGGVAVRVFVHDRPTLDFDILIGEGDWDGLKSFLNGLNAESTGSGKDIYTFRVPGYELDIDAFVARSQLNRDALRNVLTRPFKGMTVNIVQPEYLAALKVKAFSERSGPEGDKDRSDIQRLVSTGKAKLEDVRSILQQNRPDLVALLDGMVK